MSRIRFALRLTAPFHHGAGASGNTAQLRVQPIWSPALEEFVEVPIWSGGAMKHKIREATRRRLPLPEIVDAKIWHLIESGGKLTKAKGGVRLDLIREVEAACPSLSLVGYSGGPVGMQSSRVRCGVTRLVCREEDLPTELAEMPEAKHSCWAWRGDDEMVTCRESRGDHARRVDVVEVETEQMIAQFQVIMPGAIMWSEISWVDLSRLEEAALALALHDIGLTPGGELQIGARGSAGWGRCKVIWFEGEPPRGDESYPGCLEVDAILATLAKVVA